MSFFLHLNVGVRPTAASNFLHGRPFDRGQRSHKLRIDLYRYRASEQGNRQDETVRSPHLHQNSFQPSQWTGFDFNLIAYVQERPWLMGQPGANNRLYGVDFGFDYRYRQAIVPNNPYHTWSGKNWQSILNVHAAKQVARKERSFDDFDTIGPNFPASAKRKERLVPSAAKEIRHPQLVFCANLEGEPWERRFGGLKLTSIRVSHCAPSTVYRISYRP
jgi:hypothetical protein